MEKRLARAWWKSTRSNGSGACVEVAVFTDGSIGVRDSKSPTGHMLAVGSAEWMWFLNAAKNGAFDPPLDTQVSSPCLVP